MSGFCTSWGMQRSHTANTLDVFYSKGMSGKELHNCLLDASPCCRLCFDRPFSQNTVSEHHDSETTKDISRPGSSPVLQKSLPKRQT